MSDNYTGSLGAPLSILGAVEPAGVPSSAPGLTGAQKSLSAIVMAGMSGVVGNSSGN